MVKTVGHSTVKIIPEAEIIIGGIPNVAAKVARIEKLHQIAPMSPLNASNTIVHIPRFVCHAILTGDFTKMRELENIDLPKIQIKDVSKGEIVTLSQATIKYINIATGEIKIEATYFK